MVDIKKMTNEQLIQEYNNLLFHLRNFGYGKFELYYIEEIEKEIEKRNILV